MHDDVSFLELKTHYSLLQSWFWTRTQNFGKSSHDARGKKLLLDLSGNRTLHQRKSRRIEKVSQSQGFAINLALQILRNIYETVFVILKLSYSPANPTHLIPNSLIPNSTFPTSPHRCNKYFSDPNQCTHTDSQRSRSSLAALLDLRT